jgi:hypothetical protein
MSGENLFSPLRGNLGLTHSVRKSSIDLKFEENYFEGQL